MARIRDTSIDPWKPGDQITLRFNKTYADISDIIEYLNKPGVVASEAIMDGLRMKIEIDKMNEGKSNIKPGDIGLINEIEQVVQVNNDELEKRLLGKLEKMLEGLPLFRDHESSATREEVEPNDEGDDLDEDPSHEDEDAMAAMQALGNF